MDIINVIMSAGKSSVDIALYTLIPIMVVMLVIMSFLDAKGVLDIIIKSATPLLRPFGVTGMAIFAMFQITFVSFAAPLASLTMMDRRGTSDRHMAATLAMLFSMGQGNVFYALIPFGLNWSFSIFVSFIGGVTAASSTYYIFGRKLSVKNDDVKEISYCENEMKNKSLISIINVAGVDAIKMSLGSIPMLTLSLTIVGLLEVSGAIAFTIQVIDPILDKLSIPDAFILPAFIKCFAGGTAYLGVISELIQHGKVTAEQLNASAGILIQTIDLPGIGIFLGISRRFVKLFGYALPGLICGLLVRSAIHFFSFF